MNLRVFQYFLTVAREENITRAAQCLHITQPTLSRQIMQLEKDMQTKLFVRTNHNIVLTDEGMLLKRRAEELLDLYDKTKQEMINNTEALSGEISIGCGETQNMAELSDIIVKFRNLHPNVTFDFYTGIADDIKERIEKGLTDIGLVIEPVEISKYNYIRLPRKEKWGVLMRKDSPLAKKAYISPKDLTNVPLIMAKRKSVRNELENWFGEYYKQLNVIATSNVSYSNRAIMVARNMGVALVHEFECMNDNVCVIPLYPEIFNRSLLVWKKDQINSNLIDGFISFSRQYILSISRNPL